MGVTAHLDVAVAGVQHFDLDRIGATEQLDVFVGRNDLARHDMVGGQRRVLARPDRIEDRDQLRAFGKAGLDADQRDHLSDSGHDVVSGQQPSR